MKTYNKFIFFVCLIMLTTLIVLTSSPPSQAQEETNENINLVNHLGGYAANFVVSGNYVYVTRGSSLTIVDISNPATPVSVAQVTDLPNKIQNLDIFGFMFIWPYTHTASALLMLPTPSTRFISAAISQVVIPAIYILPVILLIWLTAGYAF